MRLLLSVISKDEADGIKNLADVIDIKDPSKGPLGPPNPETVKSVRGAAGPGKVISVALGEASPDYKADAKRAMTMVEMGADIIKIALADVSGFSPVEAVSFIRNTLPGEVKLVLVAYADGAKRGFMEPATLPSIAGLSCADGILIDTCDKTGLSLFDSINTFELENILEESKTLGLTTALAGCLDMGDIEKLASLAPDYAGFRSAITIGKERGSDGVDCAKAMLLKEKLSSIQTESVL
ncbi:hypothetical protein MNBD_NITROSPINAE02-1986 [hydrothermal vent metagenome]|uniref:(5-formylfuran-3-yl)methyl phosphate synthase n=1 Tax=hydrothermal vent metagenome TaxID=652676 RepID=A0A3B1CKL5_9ZZZZ